MAKPAVQLDVMFPWQIVPDIAESPIGTEHASVERGLFLLEAISARLAERAKALLPETKA